MLNYWNSNVFLLKDKKNADKISKRLLILIALDCVYCIMTYHCDKNFNVSNR